MFLNLQMFLNLVFMQLFEIVGVTESVFGTRQFNVFPHV